MKRIYCLLFAMLPLAAMAGEVKVTKPVLTLENDTLTLDFKFNMEAVKVNSTQSYAFTPVLFAGKNCKTLPPVVVTGKNKFKMRHKDRKLARKGDYNAPYTIIKGKSADRQNLVNYTIRLPYEEWMSQADMWILQEGRKDCLLDLPEIQVIEPVVVVEEEPLPQKGSICEPCMSMVSYLTPTEKPLKVRSEQNTLYIEYAVGGTEFKADFISAADIQRHVMIRMLVSVDRGQRLQISTACLKTQRDCTTSQIVYKRHVFLWYFKTLINALNLLFFTQILLAQNFCRFCICRCLNSFRTFILSKNRHGALGHHSECQKDRHYFFLHAHLSFFQ